MMGVMVGVIMTMMMIVSVGLGVRCMRVGRLRMGRMCAGCHNRVSLSVFYLCTCG